MRNLNECQAEVFRRSEKRIKARKKRRNRILMACIPLVLCITLFSAFILPGMMAAGPADKIAPESSNELYVAETAAAGEGLIGLFAGAVEVSGNGMSHSYTSVEDVQEIMGLIDEIVAASASNESDALSDYITKDSAFADVDGKHKEKGYKILVRGSDGSDTEYLLVGSMLIDQSTQEAFHLDGDSYIGLKEALGIPYY